MTEELRDQIQEAHRRRDHLLTFDVQTEEQYAIVKGILGVDQRATLYEDDRSCSVLQGLSFDSDRSTSQMTVLLDQVGNPIAVTTFILTPKMNVLDQRYVRVMPSGLQIVDYECINGGVPDYLLIPGWTFVEPEFRTQYAVAGLRYIKEVLDIVKMNAPSTTGIEVVPKGTKPTCEVAALLGLDCGSYIESTIIRPDDVGLFDGDSTSSDKFAKHLGLRRLEGIGNLGGMFSLGPVYSGQLVY